MLLFYISLMSNGYSVMIAIHWFDVGHSLHVGPMCVELYSMAVVKIVIEFWEEE